VIAGLALLGLLEQIAGEPVHALDQLVTLAFLGSGHQ